MNFKYMNKEAWLLEDYVLYKGIVKRKLLRHIFIPNNNTGAYEYIKRKDIGKILFKNDVHIVYAGLGHLERIS